MADYFLDPPILIAYFKKEDSRTYDLIVSVIEGRTSAAISAVTVAEVWSVSAMAEERARHDRRTVIEFCQVIAVERRTAERGGELRWRYNLALPDALIAACAEQAGGYFLSKDPHFKRLLDAHVLAGEVYE